MILIILILLLLFGGGGGYYVGGPQYLIEIVPDGAVHKVLIENGLETMRGKM